MVQFQHYHGRVAKSRSFIDALRHAMRGICFAVVLEPNVRRQMLILALAVLVAMLLQVPLTQTVVVLLVSTAVLVVELMNSAVEALADALHPDYNEAIQRSKDMAAGAVLLVSGAALLIGAAIFIPPLLVALERL